MKRGFKKFIYGLFYLSLLGVFVLLVVKSITKTTPTCFDNIQNQNEAGIDCGGPCTPCDIKNLIPLDEAAPSRIFSLASGKAFALFKVENQNTDYHAMPFSYTVNVLDLNGVNVESWTGSDFLFAGETRYILETRITPPARSIGSVSIRLSDPVWKSVNDFVPPSLSLNDIKTDMGSSWLRVSGTVKNGSSFSANNVRVVAILRSKSGAELFASQTVLTSVSEFGTESFTVSFPFDTTLIKELDPNGTRVFASSK